MRAAFRILFQSFVKRFYKENAGTFIFLFTMLFCIISKVDGAGLYHYHYVLATGMLQSNVFLLLIFFLWFLYVRKYVVFVSDIISDPHYSFLQVYNQLPKNQRFRLFFAIEMLLLMPVLIYTLFIAFVGLQQQLYFPVTITLLYLLLLCTAATAWHVYQLNFVNKKLQLPYQQLSNRLQLSAYPLLLLRFVVHKQINTWLGVTIFTCGILYLIARNNNAVDNDVSIAFLFYSLGVLANGILIFRIRTFEALYLGFYKALPVSLVKRFLQYILLYFLLFIPECITALLLTPAHLTFTDSINFILCGFSLLLWMNSLTFFKGLKMKAYIVLLLASFFIECIFLVTAGLFYSYLAFCILAVMLFFNKYHAFETVQDI